MVVSGWFGGRLVYEQGMRAQGVDPIGRAPDLPMLPRDAGVARALEQSERYAPSSGPVLH